MSSTNQPSSSAHGTTHGQMFDLTAEIQVNTDAIVSKTLRKSAELNLTLFAFDKGQGLSGHSSPMDAYVHILLGKMDITVGGESFTLSTGQLIFMPATIPHALEALEPSKMLLTMVPKSTI